MQKTKKENFFNSKKSDINVLEVCQVFKSVMLTSNIELKRNALNLICKICKYIGFSFCQVSNHIIEIIEETKNIPDEWRWKTYYSFVKVLGIGSGLYKKFDYLSSLLIEQIKTYNNISDDLTQLIISLLQTSLPMINSQTIFRLQLVVCSKLINFELPINILKLLNAFLQFNHDEVPLPLNIAQSICNRYYEEKNDKIHKEIEKCRILTNIYSRPKIPCLPVKVLEENVVSSSQSLIELESLIEIDDTKSDTSNQSNQINESDKLDDFLSNQKHDLSLSLKESEQFEDSESIKMLSSDNELSDDDASIEILSAEKIMENFQPE